jgi:hypothetical protein
MFAKEKMKPDSKSLALMFVISVQKGARNIYMENNIDLPSGISFGCINVGNK